MSNASDLTQRRRPTTGDAHRDGVLTDVSRMAEKEDFKYTGA
jgi:hypothetical protein